MTMSADPTLRRKRRLTRPRLGSPQYSPELRKEPQESFLVTLFKVGSTVLAVSSIFYVVFIYQSIFPGRNEYTEEVIRAQRLRTIPPHRYQDHDAGKVDTLPSFELSEASRADAFGIANAYFHSIPSTEAAGGSIQKFLEVAKNLRQQFSDSYGGESSARALLERGLSVVTDGTTSNTAGPIQLAARIREAKLSNRGTFRMAFGGNSAAAGYGNFFNQNYSFVVKRLLTEAFGLLGLSLDVLNGSMEGVSTFPYTWCGSNYLGKDIDLLSWDFGPSSEESLEAFIRSVLAVDSPPVLMFRDDLGAAGRQSIIQRYVESGKLIDPFVIDVHQVMPPFSNVKENALPPGLQAWNEFGAPPGAPGKIPRNLTVKQHELIGWITSMHILSAMELVVADALVSSVSWPEENRSGHSLPSPFSKSLGGGTFTGAPWHSFLYRDESPSDSEISCRTSFDPVLSGGLSDIVLSGVADDDMDLLHPKGAKFFQQGWVLGLEAADRREKQLMKQWNNLGFLDYKKAYYGVRASGSLKLFLPAAEIGKEPSRVSDVFHSLVVCESHVPAGKGGCDLEKDVTFTVGGIKASHVRWIEADAVSFNGKHVCVHIDIPESSSLDKRDQIQPGKKEEKMSEHGLILEIVVSSDRVLWNQGPCSIAQVIWENPPDHSAQRRVRQP